MNKCRLCNKVIGIEYTDSVLFCSRCRKEVEKSIGYNEKVITKDNLVEYLENELHIRKQLYTDVKNERDLLKMSLEEKDENCYSLAKENARLKSLLDRMETLIAQLDNRYDNLREEFTKILS